MTKTAEKTPTPETWPRRLARTARSWGTSILWFSVIFFGMQEWRRSSLLPTGDGSPAPAVTLLDLDGREVPLASFRGKGVLLHFWGPW